MMAVNYKYTMFFKVLLFCMITYGHSRPSDADERDEIIRESKKEKYFQHDSVGEVPLHQTEPSAPENFMLNRLKSIAHLRVAETRKPAADSLTREELEALRDLLDRNLQKYQNYDERSVKRRRPGDPYVGQALHDLDGEPSHLSDGGDYPRPAGDYPRLAGDYPRPAGDYPRPADDHRVAAADRRHQTRQHQLPVRRKIIRHTVFATPPQGGNRPNGNDNNNNKRIYDATRIDWTSPWAEYFPILIQDPFQAVMNSFSEIIEYGPAADICRHADGGADDGDESTNRVDRRGARRTVRPETLRRSRRNAAEGEEEKGVLSHAARPFRPHHGTAAAAAAATTTEAPKVYHWATDRPAGEHNGDTGPQIKRLVVRRGGVAIAGPGGIATAGSGGTAIVGPGGSAYSSRDTASGATADAAPAAGAGGVSMAGYGPQMVQGPAAANFYAAYPHHLYGNNNVGGYGRSVGGGGAGGGTAVLSADGVVYTFPVPSRGLTAAGGGARRRSDDGDGPGRRRAAGGREIALPDGAKLIATGPIVYYNPEPAGKNWRKGRRGDSRRNEIADDGDYDQNDDENDDDDDDDDGTPRRRPNN